MLVPDESLRWETVDELERQYSERAIPEFGGFAPLWAYGEVLRALVLRVRGVTLDVIEKLNTKIAR